MEMREVSSLAGWRPTTPTPQDRASLAPSFELVGTTGSGPGGALMEERRGSGATGPDELTTDVAAGAAGAGWCWLAGVALGTSMVVLGSLSAIYWGGDERPASPHLPHAPDAGQPVVLEINTRAWLYALAQRGGGIPVNCGQYVCLKDVPDSEWQNFKDDHIDFVWLMGMWRLGELGLEEDRREMDRWRAVLPDATVDDVIGSPFSIFSYAVNPAIATAADVAAVRGTLRRLGMKLMLDFVPNHSAKDAMWLSSNPGMYLRRPQGDHSPDAWWGKINDELLAYGRSPFDLWDDTLQLNYWSAETVEVMAAALHDIASMADAIRVDMALLALNDVWERTWGSEMEAAGFRRPAKEFWEVAISKVRQDFPDTILLAEAYDYGITEIPERQLLLQLGFDFVYDKPVLDKLAGAAGDLSQLVAYVSAEPALRSAAHFVENHDSPRAAAALGGQQQAFVGAVIASTLPGLRIFNSGQFDGLSKQLLVQLRRAVAEEPSPAVHGQFSRLLAALADPVFRDGEWNVVPIPAEPPAKAMVAWRWSRRSARRLVVANFGAQEAAATLQLPDAVGQGGGDGLRVTDLLTGVVSQQSASQMRGSGLPCTLGPWTAQILDYGTPARHTADSQPMLVAQ